ncbi:MAG TPA: CHAT domain-containing protein, partial [Thermoanaerobaculia bacterium]
LRLGRPDQAAQLLAQAIEALETRAGRIGGSRDTQAGYRASYEEIYRDAIDAELARGNAAKAFHLLERSRARSFLTLLAERDLAFGELPEALERSRRDVAARYDRKLRELTQAGGEEAQTALRRELDRLRQERDEIAEKIRAASPRLASLREPRPLGFEVVRDLLDPGTLALSYSVGKDKTVLFAVTRNGDLQVRTLPLGEERLRREIQSFLERVRSQQAPAEISAMAAGLYRELIGPVAELVERSERVLILPDGPLHRLPFGALVRNTGSTARFLIEEKPLHTALSLTVYITLRVSAPAAGPIQLVAFGDPLIPKSLQAKNDLGPGLRGFDWSSLPYSRSEVERIAGAYPGAARLYLGKEATEERAKTVRGARILHFATHGYTDDRTPLDSALVLTIPEELSQGRDNGLLQVWEIFESVRLDADLVVLSACESALGRELSGEGLVGLTRAFQYAGARSVVASLWSVADQVTAELMARFHRHLAAGLPKDQALRAAQIGLIREPLRITTASGEAVETDASAPFFWAAFQLFGDWR